MLNGYEQLPKSTDAFRRSHHIRTTFDGNCYQVYVVILHCQFEKRQQMIDQGNRLKQFRRLDRRY